MDKYIVLYICIDPSLGGSTASLYNLIISIKEKVYPIVLFPKEGIGYDFFVQQGIESYVFPFIRLHEYKANSFFEVWKHPSRWHYLVKKKIDYGCYKYLKKSLSGRKIAIIHSNTSPNDIGVLLSKKFHAKHVWHIREFCDLHFNYEIYGGMNRLRHLINHADGRIAISSAIKKHWNLIEKNTWVLNDAIRSEKDICYIPKKKRYYLFCSYYLTENKGARFAINAFGISGIYKTGYKLKLIGNCDDGYRQSLMETAQRLGCKDYVEFVPCQTELKSYFANATAFIMASKNEGLGRVTAEAMFFGCPVIAHASGGTLDLVKHGDTGWLFYTEEECAKLISEICLEPQEDIIKNAQKIVQRMTEEMYGPQIMKIYHHVLNER